MRTIVKWIVSIIVIIVTVELFLANFLTTWKTKRRAPSWHGEVISREELLKNHAATLELENTLEKERLKSVNNLSDKILHNIQGRTTVHVACVVCGLRSEQALTMLKSIVIFNLDAVQFHIFAEDHLHKNITGRLESWPDVKSGNSMYKMYPITFPEGQNAAAWKKLFRPCASQRLFLPMLLHDVDSVIYLDIDTLLLTNIISLWSHFEGFNSTQLAGMTQEGEVPALNWYKRFARHPFYGELGLNSGVMLMNLTRMRQFKWEEKVVNIYKDYRNTLTWGDQDIINIIFNKHPECLYLLTCDNNYRPDHCMYGNNCPYIKSQGIKVLHGNREVFYNQKELVFRAVYESFAGFNFTEFSLLNLSGNIEKNITSLKKSYCKEITNDILFLINKEYAERTL